MLLSSFAGFVSGTAGRGISPAGRLAACPWHFMLGGSLNLFNRCAWKTVCSPEQRNSAKIGSRVLRQIAGKRGRPAAPVIVRAARGRSIRVQRAGGLLGADCGGRSLT
jgi:hypothetical protein